MKLLNSDVWGSIPALQLLFEKDWPIDESLKLAKLIKKLNGPYSVVEKVRSGLVKKHQTIKSDQGVLKPLNENHENWKAFSKDFIDLMVKEYDESIDIEPIKLPKKVDGKSIVINPKTLIILEKIVTFE